LYDSRLVTLWAQYVGIHTSPFLFFFFLRGIAVAGQVIFPRIGDVMRVLFFLDDDFMSPFLYG